MRRSETLSERLRAETAQEHAQLESTLDLMRPPLDRERFRRVLCGFHGFHRTWEPAIARHPAGALITPRLHLLRQDLAALGLNATTIDALPLEPEAARLADDASAAWGSAYVMEGSTLGGQVIGRALAQAPWTPAGGLRYFNPHGGDTGRHWRAFKAALDEAQPPSAWPAAIAGARDTFTLLAAWLRPGRDDAPYGDRS